MIQVTDLFTPKEVTYDVMNLNCKMSAENLQKRCADVINDAGKIEPLKFEFTKAWRDFPHGHIRRLKKPDTGTIQAIPITIIPVDTSGRHFLLIARIVSTDSMAHNFITPDVNDQGVDSGINLNAGDHFTALVDTGAGIGAIHTYCSNYCNQYPNCLRLMPADSITFEDTIATPTCCYDTVDIDDILASGNHTPPPAPDPDPDPDPAKNGTGVGAGGVSRGTHSY